MSCPIRREHYTHTEKIDILLAFQAEKYDNILALLLLVRDESVMGFMSGGMVVDTVAEVFAIASTPKKISWVRCQGS